MASLYKRKRLEIITIVYWFLLLYIVAALIWWFIALWQQNERMVAYEKEQLSLVDAAYQQKLQAIEEDRQRKIAQYTGEGTIFLLLILVGAVFVYQAVRKQIKLNQQQQNFMMAVTHELKTPIAVAKLNLETLKKRKLEESQQEKLIQNTLQEANRLNDLCNNILLTSQMETSGFKVSEEKIQLSELVESAVNDFRNRFPSRPIQKQIDQEIFITGDHLLIQLAVNNLIDNALKYSAKEQPVIVALWKQNGQANFSVTDAGSGIDNNEKKKIFEKFYRVGTESTRQTKGTGLGLFLTKKIVEEHHAVISVTDNQPTGSIFAIRFPKQPI